MEAILERDGHCCVWCSKSLTLGHRDLTFEHVVPKLKGGPAWAENEVPACRSCNRQRGHAAPSSWLYSARQPRRHVVERSLLALEAAIARRGGQRKARRYLARELRRLGLNEPAAAGAVLGDSATRVPVECMTRSA
jgi:hypothetical protein